MINSLRSAVCRLNLIQLLHIDVYLTVQSVQKQKKHTAFSIVYLNSISK